MKGAAALAMLLCAAAAVTLAAQRIYTTPHPDAELKLLFPAATTFSPLAGQPLHFKAYAADPWANPTAKPIGFAFWTTDLVPQEHGYHGPIHILVGMDLTATLTGVIVTYNSEPYGYFSVEPPKFAAQFKGKNIRDPFVVGRDVEAVSRSTISIVRVARAYRDSPLFMSKHTATDVDM